MYSDVWSLDEMERWSVQHGIAAVDCLSEQSVTAIQRGFHRKFQRLHAPCPNTLLLWRQEGSVKDSKPQGCSFMASTPDNVEQVRDARRHVAKSAQVSSVASSRISLKRMQPSPNSPQGFVLLPAIQNPSCSGT
jgi:hypothetical protein